VTDADISTRPPFHNGAAQVVIVDPNANELQAKYLANVPPAVHVVFADTTEQAKVIVEQNPGLRTLVVDGQIAGELVGWLKKREFGGVIVVVTTNIFELDLMGLFDDGAANIMPKRAFWDRSRNLLASPSA
jgi:hypothetical protein